MSSRLPMIAAGLVLACACPLAAAQGPATSANERFARLDVNHDGGLSRYEVDAEVFLAGLDTNGDQHISADELEALLQASNTKASPLDRVRIADRNADDLLDIDELQRASSMRFDWMDQNDDGNIDPEELRERFGVKMVGGE